MKAIEGGERGKKERIFLNQGSKFNNLKVQNF